MYKEQELEVFVWYDLVLKLCPTGPITKQIWSWRKRVNINWQLFWRDNKTAQNLIPENKYIFLSLFLMHHILSLFLLGVQVCLVS